MAACERIAMRRTVMLGSFIAVGIGFVLLALADRAEAKTTADASKGPAAASAPAKRATTVATKPAAPPKPAASKAVPAKAALPSKPVPTKAAATPARVPAKAGAGIDHYTVTALPGGATCATPDATTTTCTVTGLTATVGYLFTVVASGVSGTGDSLPSIAGSLSPATAPDPPTAVNAVAGNQTVTVSWTAPATVRGGVSGYTVTASPGGAVCATLSAAATSCC
nr:hypothetical protein GCM10020063_004830 [Dactylosporangium thailandense]